MKKERGIEVFLIVVLAMVVLVMSVGFAAFTQTLNLNGNVTVKKSTWDVHFVSNSYALTTANNIAAADTTAATITNTSVAFAATLRKPGDIYSFKVQVANTGDYDAKLTSITMSSLTEAQAKLLTYTVTYGSADYTTTTTGLSTALAATTGTEDVTITVAYKSDVAETDLPSSDLTVNLTATLGYAQA